MASADPKVLSWGDTVLRHTDVELLRGDHWLNDTVIGFQVGLCRAACSSIHPMHVHSSRPVIQSPLTPWGPPRRPPLRMQFERLADGVDGALPPRCAVFVPPAMAFLLCHLPDPQEAGPLFAGTGLDSHPLALLAVNNNRDVDQAAGGSHWCDPPPRVPPGCTAGEAQ